VGKDIPCAVNTTRLCLVESGLLATRVETNDQSADAKWPHTSTLCISLLHTSHVFRDVLNSHWVLHSQAMTLRFETCLIHQNTGVCIQAGEGQTDVVVDQGDLRGCNARVLQFHGRLLFAAKYDDAFAFDCHGAGAAFDCFQGILNLKDVTVRGED
jgi:hypothetical protein